MARQQVARATIVSSGIFMPPIIPRMAGGWERKGLNVQHSGSPFPPPRYCGQNLTRWASNALEGDMMSRTEQIGNLVAECLDRCRASGYKAGFDVIVVRCQALITRSANWARILLVGRHAATHGRRNLSINTPLGISEATRPTDGPVLRPAHRHAGRPGSASGRPPQPDAQGSATAQCGRLRRWDRLRRRVRRLVRHERPIRGCA
jgi:hypothetical protein